MDVKKFHVYRTFSTLDVPSARICCLILTSPKSFLTRAKAVNATWGPRCDQYYFITEVLNASLTAEQVNISKQLPIAPIKNIAHGYDHLTQKSTLAFLFAYEQHFNDFDWFVKADDDTFLIVDHLRAFLSEQNSSEPVTFGYNFKVSRTSRFRSFRPLGIQLRCSDVLLCSLLGHCPQRVPFGRCLLRSQSRVLTTIS